MRIKRKLVDYLVQSSFLRGLIQRAYVSILKYEIDFEKLSTVQFDSTKFRGIKNSFFHFESIRALARELRIENQPCDLVRFGGMYDGGYVMATPFTTDLTVLSLGVGNDISWDQDLSRFAHTIHLYDHTVDELPVRILGATHFKEEVGTQSDVGTTTLVKCISRLPKSGDYILKIDIEGAEWTTLAEIDAEKLALFSQIIIEFHDFHRHIFDGDFLLILGVLQKLRINHNLVNFHPNNFGGFEIIGNHPVPDVFEVTYLRKDWKVSDNLVDLDSLNSPNTTSNPDIILKFP